MRWFLKLIVGVKFDDSKFLLGEKQFIIVANHNSHLDTMTIMASLPRKIIHKVKPVAAADYFARTKLQGKFSKYFINALLIQRKRDKNNPLHDPIHTMLQCLEEGYSLILFPEGTRGEPEKLQPLKPGIAILLSKRPDIPYVPAFMEGMGRIMPKGDNLVIPYNSTLRFGNPMKIAGTEVSSIMQQVEKDLLRLKDQRVT
jgi:1-acyl-sn-glycerol-3-phosphate acyltransferase